MRVVVHCAQCNTENPEQAKFCLNCGARLALSCPQCSTPMPPEARFCFACGAELSTPQAVRPTPPSSDTQAPAPDFLTERLLRLVPQEYADRLVTTRGQVPSERRLVTILFTDVKGSTAMAEALDPEDVMEIMSGAFDLLIEPVVRHEGTVARLMGDAVLAFFGAPLSHEDDPERAVHAALEILAGARQYAARLEAARGLSGFDVRIGINTGLVVVGEVGSDLRVEYTAMGDAINLAARMEQNAPPGSILISHDTYRHIRGVFDVDPQEPLTVKGKADPVQTYLVQRAKPRPFRKPLRAVEGIETRMVGREAELKHLQDALYMAMEDSGLQLVTVSGEAGVGKSRLLYEFDIWAEALPDQFYYFKGRAFPEMQHVPYSLLRNLIAFRFQILDSDPPATVREKLEAGVSLALGNGGDSQRAAHILGHLVGLEFGTSEYLVGVDDDAQGLRDEALADLGDYFEGMAAQFPLLILLEDLQWADDSSLDVLNHLAMALIAEPVMVGCAARPALFERRPHWGEGQAFHSRLELRPLSIWDSRRLVAEILQRVEEVPEALRDLLVARAEGNPFFMEELIKMLAEDGVILSGEDLWHVKPSRLAEVQVPPTLTGVLQARLDRLPLEERAVLQEASVVGRLFWDQAVVRIHGSTTDAVRAGTVAENLSGLRRREMVYKRETSAFANTQEYIFKHALLREVTYESVLKQLRKLYHGLVADWLLQQSGERVDEYTALIADHLEMAGRTEEAVDYVLQAGDRARALYALPEAIRAYERALAMLKAQGHLEQAARTLMKLGLAYHTAFDFQAARQAYDEGFVLWERGGGFHPSAALPPAPHALRVDWFEGITTLDPAMAVDSLSIEVIDHLFRGLVKRGPDMEIVPDLAQMWEILDEGRTYVFHLREGVRWSDGTEVTSGDLEYAWKRALAPATVSPAANLLYDVKGAQAFHRGVLSDPAQVGVQARDRVTLAVELEEPTGYFLQLLAHCVTYPVPQHVVEACGASWTEVDNIVTTGPFRLKARQCDEEIILERNPAYRGPFRGNLQRLELSLIAEPAARLQMYRSGNLDILFLWSLPPAELDRARQQHAGEYVSGPFLHTLFIVFDFSRQPFADPRVRRAFVEAIDREALADLVVQGTEFPAGGGLVPPGMPGHSPVIGLPYDLDHARHLLDNAGYPLGSSGIPVLDLLVPRGAEPIAEYLQTQWWEGLGVRIVWEPLEWSSYLDKLDQEPPYLFLIGWQADYPDPDCVLRVCRHATHWTGWRNEAYDALVEGARHLLDQEERIKQYQRADRILIEEAAVMPLTYGRLHLLVKPWVKRFPMSPIKICFFEDVVIEPH